MECLEGIRLLSQKSNPNVPREIIYRHKNILIPTEALHLHRTHKVHMKELKNSTDSEMVDILMRGCGLLFNLTFSTIFSFLTLRSGIHIQLLWIRS